MLYDRRTGEIHRAGPSDFDGMEDQLRDAASQGTSFFDPERKRVITAVRLGSEPIASFAIQGAFMQDSVLQGISNLIAIGLERARAQDLAHQVEAARRSEQLRTTLHRRHGARIQDAAHFHPRRHYLAVVLARSAAREPHRTARSG